jgi:hypothetical protein
MLNPFIFGPNRKLQKTSRLNGEIKFPGEDSHVWQSVVWKQLTLRLGMVLIRMGNGLIGEKTIREGSEVPCVPVGQVKIRKPRGSRLHHA